MFGEVVEVEMEKSVRGLSGPCAVLGQPDVAGERVMMLISNQDLRNSGAIVLGFASVGQSALYFAPVANQNGLIVDLVGMPNDRPLVLRHTGDENSTPVMDAFGTVNIGHRLSVWAGMDTIHGRVTPTSSHTHQDHLLNLNQWNAGRTKLEWSLVDYEGLSQFIGTFYPEQMPDPSHTFFELEQHFFRAAKRTNSAGVESVVVGPGIEMFANATRVGYHNSYTEYGNEGIVFVNRGSRLTLDALLNALASVPAVAAILQGLAMDEPKQLPTPNRPKIAKHE